MSAIRSTLSRRQLLQLGDAESALLQADEGLERCRSLANPRLLSALLINRVIALCDSGFAGQIPPPSTRSEAAELMPALIFPRNRKGSGSIP